MKQTTNQGSNTPKRKFPAGTILISDGVLRLFQMPEITRALARHTRCDWGKLSFTYKDANDRALEVGARLFSTYRVRRIENLCFFTEADRSATSIMLHNEVTPRHWKEFYKFQELEENGNC